jgi:hypothetical protein
MEIFPDFYRPRRAIREAVCHRDANGCGDTVVGLIAAGETVETVATEYQLSLEQVRAALAYAAHVAAHLPPAVRQAS